MTEFASMGWSRYVYIRMGLTKTEGFGWYAQLYCLLSAVMLSARCFSAVPSEWPMFRGNPALTGVSEAKLDNSLTLLWTFKTEKSVKSSPAISANRVFIGS